MRFFDHFFRGVSIEMPPMFDTRSIATKTFVLAFPVLSIILSIIFFITARSADSVMERAITQNAQFKASALSTFVEHLLHDMRNQLLMLATGPVDLDEMIKVMRARAEGGSLPFREVAFIGASSDDRYVLITHEDSIVNVPTHVAMEAPGSPLSTGRISRSRGHVSISRPQEVTYPLLPVKDAMQSVFLSVLRFSTPVYNDAGDFKGILSVSFDLMALRDKLASVAPLPGLSPADDSRCISFFFDREGWMVFQSGNQSSPDRPLDSDIVRAGFHGDFGRPGFSKAFKPAAEHLNYWSMVSDIQDSRSGVVPLNLDNSLFSSGGSLAASYAPVTFKPDEGADPHVLGGIALLDENYSKVFFGRKLTSVYIYSFCACVLLVILILTWFARSMSSRIRMISNQIERSNNSDSIAALAFPPMAREFEKLGKEVNDILARLRAAKEMEQNNATARNMRKKLQPVSNLPMSAPVHGSSLVGESPQMLSLYRNIEKAANVNADVLVIGETGTGKELVSHSIHKLSSRRGCPFISINCGALDEALLMDTLFGHVKGAFTEAKTDRKGAFLAAAGGTLLLDEIGNAPEKVQQALLRALSTRQIRPLGSDLDISFDARVIAATNAPLNNERQDFRNDLYYRLAVITIETPPLRAHKDDIRLLLVHFLNEKSREYGYDFAPAISHGALEKLLAHDWPGNVRELRNILTRALTFCDGKIILAEDLKFTASNGANEVFAINCENTLPEEKYPASQPKGNALDYLNKRQAEIWPAVASLSSFTRQEYQNIAGGISQRTAQYDLGIMVKLGLLSRVGKGPMQRYIVILTNDSSKTERV